MSKKKHAQERAGAPVVVYDVAALERVRRDTQIAKQRDARARARERRLDRLFSISTDPLISYSRLHERPRADDKVAYPLSTPFAAHLDRVRDASVRAQERHERVCRAPSLLAARYELRRRYPELHLVFEMITFGGLSQSALARQLGTTPSCIHKRLDRAVRLLEEFVDTLRVNSGDEE